MADIATVSKAVCTKPDRTAPEQANCEANVRNALVVDSCVTGKSKSAAIKCIGKKLPGPALWAPPAGSGAPTPAELINKVRAGGSLAPDEQKVVNAHIEKLLASEAVPSKDRTPADQVNVAELGQIRDAAEKNPAIKGILDAATAVFNLKKGGNDSSGSEFGKRSGFFAEAGVGLALTTATYGDSVTDADSVASDNAIKTGAYGVGRSPSGNYPGHRFEGSLGYAFAVDKDLNIRLGAHYRKSVVQQGFENPTYGRSVSDLYQDSLMVLLGVERHLSPSVSVFADLMVGATRNAFADNSGYLPTSAASTQYAPLKNLERVVMSGGIRGGVVWRLFGLLSVYSALSVYTDASDAETRTDGGRAFKYGTRGAEATATVGVKASQ